MCPDDVHSGLDSVCRSEPESEVGGCNEELPELPNVPECGRRPEKSPCVQSPVARCSGHEPNQCRLQGLLLQTKCAGVMKDGPPIPTECQEGQETLEWWGTYLGFVWRRRRSSQIKVVWDLGALGLASKFQSRPHSPPSPHSPQRTWRPQTILQAPQS